MRWWRRLPDVVRYCLAALAGVVGIFAAGFALAWVVIWLIYFFFNVLPWPTWQAVI